MTSAVIYRGLCLEVAWSNRSVAVVDAFKAHQAALRHEKLSEAEVVEDGVHFSGLGYQVSYYGWMSSCELCLAGFSRTLLISSPCRSSGSG